MTGAPSGICKIKFGKYWLHWQNMRSCEKLCYNKNTRKYFLSDRVKKKSIIIRFQLQGEALNCNRECLLSTNFKSAHCWKLSNNLHVFCRTTSCVPGTATKSEKKDISYILSWYIWKNVLVQLLLLPKSDKIFSKHLPGLIWSYRGSGRLEVGTTLPSKLRNEKY